MNKVFKMSLFLFVSVFFGLLQINGYNSNKENGGIIKINFSPNKRFYKIVIDKYGNEIKIYGESKKNLNELVKNYKNNHLEIFKDIINNSNKKQNDSRSYQNKSGFPFGNKNQK